MSVSKPNILDYYEFDNNKHGQYLETRYFSPNGNGNGKIWTINSLLMVHYHYFFKNFRKLMVPLPLANGNGNH